jgi:hypothetical protein
MLSAPEKMRITFPIIGFVARGKNTRQKEIATRDAFERRTTSTQVTTGSAQARIFPPLCTLYRLCEFIVLGFFRLGGFFLGADHCRNIDTSLFPRFMARLRLHSHRQF